MKTVAELNDEYELLAGALTKARALSFDRTRLSHAVQAAQTRIVLGTGERHELIEAQRQADESVDATLRCVDLEQAIGENREMFKHAQGIERREHCHQLADSHSLLYVEYKQQSTHLFETYK